MPIEFDCPHCQHRLRTPDDKAGMSAKCPACGERVWIPYPHEAAGDAPGADPEPAPATEEELVDLAELEDRRPCPECGGDNPASNRECEFCGASLRRRSSNSRRRRVQPDNAADRLVQPGDLAIGGMLSDAWKIYCRDLVALVFGWLLLHLSVFIVSFPLFLCIGVTGVFSIFISQPLSWFIGALTGIGVNYLYFKAAHNQQPTIGDAFAGFSAGSAFLGAMFLYTMLYTLMTFAGFLLLVIPGLFLTAIGWVFPRVLMDEGLDGVAAISRGWQLASSQLGTVLLVALTCIGIGILAVIPIVGPIFVFPYLGMFCTVAYLRMTGQSVAVDEQPSEAGSASWPAHR